MKTIVSLLLVLCLVSCSQPKPPPAQQAKYESVDLANEPASVSHAQTSAAVNAEPAPATKAPAAPVLSKPVTNVVTEAQPAPAEHPAATTNGVPSPFAHPAQPAIPATAAAPPPAPGAHPAPPSANAPQEPLLPELSVNFHAAPIDLVLQTYADFVHRTLLRSPNINAQTTVTLVQQNPLTKTELVQAMDAVLAMNNIAMVPIGEKFIKVVPIADVNGAGMNIDDMNASMLPQFGPFDTRIVQLKYTKPSDMVSILQQFTKTPAAILPIEGANMIILRDTAENVRVMLDVINRLDTSVPNEIESEVIPIKYALASDIAN
ncbi:MAG TPA: secretin N-terminal domain-containing protein, partial [Candidatus Polarisedimenticolia bacterium]|nr:secretin N-terminal domain-containing protein [Candidatus Polarisedimenticolia bacterium]